MGWLDRALKDRETARCEVETLAREIHRDACLEVGVSDEAFIVECWEVCDRNFWRRKARDEKRRK